MSSDQNELREVCKKAVENKDYLNALPLAESYRANFPTDPAGGVMLALAKRGVGDLQGAIDLLEQYQAQFPADPNFPFLIATIYQDMSRHGWAERYLKRTLELKPDWSEATLRLGVILSKAGRSQEAVPYLRSAMQHYPKHFIAAYNLGSALNDLGEIEEAALWMSKAHALAPNNSAAKQDAEDFKNIVKSGTKRRGRIARWPESADEFQDIKPFIRKYLLNDFDRQNLVLKPGMTVLTQGSCFAEHLADSLTRFDLSVGTFRMGEEHNSTYANRGVFRWLRDGVVDDSTAIIADNHGAARREEFRDLMRRCDVYVYTLGVAPAFFSKADGKFTPARAGTGAAVALVRNNTFRTTTVAENVENLRWMIGTFREFNPRAKVVITVSPVPLRSTTEMSSVIMADCVSKSTLRVAAHELLQAGMPGVLYWPSFEIVRWIGAHMERAMYGHDDGSANHVDFAMVDLIIDCFIETFGGSTLIPIRAASRTDDADPPS